MRIDLRRYENCICAVATEAIFFVAKNEVGSYDALRVERTLRMPNLGISNRRYDSEIELHADMPFLAPNRTPHHVKRAHRTFRCYGIFGFIRFLHGYYVIIITDRSQVATVGHHAIHKIDRVETIYIPTTQAGLNDPNELRYLRIFQNNDLTSNFYLSYTYDVTRTLQSWIDGPPLSPFDRSFDSKYTWNNYLIEPMMEQLNETDSQHWILPVIHGFCGQGNVNVFGRHIYITLVARRSRHYAGTRYLKRGISTRGYVANEVETEQIVFENPTLALKIPTEKSLPTDGIALCSSFVQVRGSVPALWTQDISMSMVGPPPISLFAHDLGMQLSGRHFSQLLARYGAPIVVLDLVKTSRKSASRFGNPTENVSSTTSIWASNGNGKQNVGNPAPGLQKNQMISPSEAQKELLLHEALMESIRYLNQYVEPKFQIDYIHIDLAHIYRKDPTGLITVKRLLDIGHRVVRSCGWCNNLTGKRQHGAVRTNCVDCLDRTNAAQLAVGFVAFGYQLNDLGIISQPQIELDSYCFRLFELLFEEMGDIMALQYGGSLLVHHFASYRRAAPWTSTSRDKLEQVSRLLNNTFSDADRQQSRNLLLGMYRPFNHHRSNREGNLTPSCALWELPNDYDLHNPPQDIIKNDSERRRRLVQWFDESMLDHLPNPEPLVGCSLKNHKNGTSRGHDAFSTYFHPHRITFFDELHEFRISDTMRHLTPAGGILLPDADLDPFVARVRRLGTSVAGAANSNSLLKRFLNYSSENLNQLSKQPSNDDFEGPSPLPSIADDDSQGSDDSAEIIMPSEYNSANRLGGSMKSPWPPNSFNSVFKSGQKMYGSHFHGIDFPGTVSEEDMKLYINYCCMAIDFVPIDVACFFPDAFKPMSKAFKSDIDFLHTTVPAESVRIYEKYVKSKTCAEKEPLWQTDDRSDQLANYLQSATIL